MVPVLRSRQILRNIQVADGRLRGHVRGPNVFNRRLDPVTSISDAEFKRNFR
jgi:hypothetical protein